MRSTPRSARRTIPIWARSRPPATPQQRYVDLWLIQTQDQFRAAAPPEIDSAEYAAAFNEVKAIGQDIGGLRTADRAESARFWTPYVVTPAHPSYLSAHAAIGGAAASILASYLGSDTAFCVTNAVATRCWNNFDAAAEDGAMSRLWGGIHWRFDNEQGLLQGRDVAAFTLGNVQFGAIPEPESWALMILGFGIVGATARRRRKAFATA